MPPSIHPTLQLVTDRIRERSAATRQRYLDGIRDQHAAGSHRGALSCGNLAHGMAACDAAGKERLTDERIPNIAIVSAYNDMLSAHQPYERYPDIIRAAARDAGAMAQFAGGVPAMCDGVTQGRDGMDLSLFSRDVIAMATAIALSHDMFDAVLCLGVCDKIVPGLVIGALTFGHLPTVFVPAGPMPSGLPNKEKAAVREAYAAGEVGRDALIAAESASYHAPGTCTFYGTANSNQMLMEFMGLQLPGSSFVPPGTPLREALTAHATRQALALTQLAGTYTPVAQIVSEATIVNAMAGLLATGGSTNHTLHLVAMAAAAGIRIDWHDFAELARVVPTLAQVYPNGMADVNAFHEAGGLGFVIRELLDAGLLNDNVQTIVGPGLRRYTEAPSLGEGGLVWQPVTAASGDRSVVRGTAEPFQTEGGLAVVEGNLGRAVVKVSAVKPEQRSITAPARVFQSQKAFTDAFDAGQLDGDLVVVVPWQGPAANGMPELHQLSPYLGTLQNRGHKVALLTDGRMSGASGKILAAIHVTPEAVRGGLIGRLRDGDIVHIDAATGRLEGPADLATRASPEVDLSANGRGMGRELFAAFRDRVGGSESGASVFAGW
ncbi:MAG: phosphogluconate dehydratase [Pseudomonadales bacterium]|nr:phosphogluconate dehydratase [Pseudomonadales bacterium]